MFIDIKTKNIYKLGTGENGVSKKLKAADAVRTCGKDKKDRK